MNRVVITGVGVVSPIGSDADMFWRTLCAGGSGISELSRLPGADYPRNLASEVKDWHHLPEAEEDGIKTAGQAVGYAISAARMALTDAGLSVPLPEDNDCCVMVGSTMANQDIIQRIVERYDLDESSVLQPAQSQEFQRFKPSLLSHLVARRFGAKGCAATYSNACAAGNYAVGIGFARIRNGDARLALVGGADPFTRVAYTIFHRLSASSGTACRPFDKDRDGMVVGEGAAFLVLEEYEHAKARGARIYAEVTGYGLSCDAYHPTAPHPEGRGAVLAMQRAMAVAGLEREDVDYISAHGTGTAANDQSEAVAMYRTFGDRMRSLPVSSIKGSLGHCMGAASAFEAVACALAIYHQVAPPTLNTVAIDPDFPVDLDVIPAKGRSMRIRNALSNAFAFGGNVASVVFGEVRQ